MRIPALTLASVLLAALPVAGCTDPRSACAAPVTGEVTFVASSVPPPYHYEWTLTLGEREDQLVLSPGYNAPERWSTTLTVPDEALTEACLRLRTLDDDDPQPGSVTLRVDLSSPGQGSLRLTTTQSKAVDTVRGVIPAAAWDEVNAPYEEWKSAYEPPR